MAFSFDKKNDPLKNKIGHTDTGELKEFSLNGLSKHEEERIIEEQKIKEEEVEQAQKQNEKEEVSTLVENKTNEIKATTTKKKRTNKTKPIKETNQEKEEIVKKKGGNGRPKNPAREEFVRHTIYLKKSQLTFLQAMAKIGNTTLTNVLDYGFTYLISETPQKDKKRIKEAMNEKLGFIERFKTQKG